MTCCEMAYVIKEHLLLLLTFLDLVLFAFLLLMELIQKRFVLKIKYWDHKGRQVLAVELGYLESRVISN